MKYTRVMYMYNLMFTLSLLPSACSNIHHNRLAGPCDCLKDTTLHIIIYIYSYL